jgi:hypothetical protein
LKISSRIFSITASGSYDPISLSDDQSSTSDLNKLLSTFNISIPPEKCSCSPMKWLNSMLVNNLRRTTSIDLIPDWHRILNSALVFAEKYFLIFVCK